MNFTKLPEALARWMAPLAPIAREFWKPVLATLVIAGASVALYSVVNEQENRLIYRVVGAEAGRLESRIGRHVQTMAAAMSSLASRWQNRAATREEWESDAAKLLSQDLEFRAIEWIEPSLEPRWIVPSTARTTKSILDSTGDEIRGRELAALVAEPDPSVSRSFPLPGAPRQFFVCAPLRSGTRVTGYLVAVVRAHDVMDALFDGEIKRGYSIGLYEDAFLLFGPDWLESGDLASWVNEGEASVGDLDWRVKIWPSDDLMRDLRTTGPPIALAVGLILSLIVGLSIYQGEAWKARALAAEARTSNASPTEDTSIPPAIPREPPGSLGAA